MTASPKTTRTNVRALQERPHADVLIVGGGINGLATFRDLALQGVDVALVERGDYVSGASSASSHMIHGGVRYLENGEFRLVKESVTERNWLVRNAPHFVKPLPTTIPIHRTFSGIFTAPFRLLVTHGRGKPNERGALLIKLGLIMYDTFSRDGGSVPRHRFHARKKSHEKFPELDKRFAYTATYYDASMHDPERLALDVLRDGEREASARAANYAEVVGSDGPAVIIRDTVTGEEFPFTAKVVVNTSGPWTDLTNSAIGEATRFMGGTRGSHIVLDNTELLHATGGNEIFFEAADGRIVLIYPLKGRVMVGTTDIDADPTQPSVCTDEEIDYFFDLIAQVFPDIAVSREQIVYTFSGIRPLPRHDDVAPGFVSRDYRIEKASLAGTPVLSLVGGKWTTFRALAETLASEVLDVLGRPRPVDTALLAIGGGAGYPRTDADRAEWIATHSGAHSAEFADRMLERYGTYASELLAVLPVAQHPLAHAPGYSREEIAFLADREEVVTLLDLLLRRTHIAFVGGVTRDTLIEVAEAAAAPLGWDVHQIQHQVDDAARSLEESHRIDVATSGLAPQPA
ncbi:MAG: FAD-dependent oxidoreductase [Microbacterium sp.]|nr:MAG: FAD-dependent oxidoreductase [Microbacterium sp.]